MPKRVKYRKYQRGTRKGIATRASEICFGEFGLKTLENAWLKNTQIEAARVLITRQLHQGGRLWMRVFPQKSVTKKPAETRMGKGKGDINCWVAVIKRGQVIFEIGGLPEELARRAMRMVAYKMPFQTKFVSRQKTF